MVCLLLLAKRSVPQRYILSAVVILRVNCGTMAERNCSATDIEGATAPSSASSGAGAGDDCPSVEDPPGTATCEVCDVKFRTGRGLSLHQRSRHPEWYHERKGPAFVRH